MKIPTPENTEWIKHVYRKNPNDKVKMSWCGVKIQNRFHFMDAEHAASSGDHKDRLMSCFACTNKIINGLSNGWEDTLDELQEIGDK